MLRHYFRCTEYMFYASEHVPTIDRLFTEHLPRKIYIFKTGKRKNIVGSQRIVVKCTYRHLFYYGGLHSNKF